MSSKKFVVGLLFGISVFSLAGAAMPEPPNPLANSNLTFDQRLEQMKQTDAALLKATPEERKEYWHKMRDQMKALSPEDRKLVHEKMKAQWQSITPEQKERMKAERKAFFDGLTPEEQAEMKARKAKWENMSPEEKQKWHKQASQDQTSSALVDSAPGHQETSKPPTGGFFIWVEKGLGTIGLGHPIQGCPLKGHLCGLIKEELAIPRPNVIPKTYKSDKVFCNHFVK